MIAVNLITGFLGVGKTTLIRELLKNHPPGQRWAVLVNEFGEIGVDGALLDQDGIAIEEVAGGCLCCVAAPAFNVGLNRLIRQHKPERILIEPSGLGHPAQVLETLRSPLYQSILDVRATLCVMDARHLQSPRHLAHPTFVDQIHLADVLIANKADTYSAADEAALMDYAAGLQPPKSRLLLCEHGRIPLDALELPGQARSAAFPEAHAFLLQQQAEPPASAGDWLMIEGQADGYHRVGWRIAAAQAFDRESILPWLDSLPLARVKAVLHCNDGWLSYNRSDDDSTISPLQARAFSSLQLIDPAPLAAAELDQKLRQTRLD